MATGARLHGALGKQVRERYAAAMSDEQPRNPLHGKTLAAILEELVAAHGWETLAEMVRIACFAKDPSIGSSLKFLRRTPWARAKVESVYLWHLRELRRRARARPDAPAEATADQGLATGAQSNVTRPVEPASS